MESVTTQNTLLIIALLLVTLSAGTGLTLAIAVLSKKKTAISSVFMHGVLSATGLILIIVYFFRHATNFPGWIVLLFVATALLGFFMFARDIREKPIRPLAVVFAHAVFALLSIISVVDWCFF
jgi:hypothetical protein